MKLNWKNTFVIGLGFFGISLVWPIYNQYMPLFYAKFIDSKMLIGWIMTIDNILAITLIPFMGYLSDRTHTRYGRRIPYLLVGAPVAAIFLFLIPFGWASSLGLLLTATIVMNLAMATFRSPVVALMPDVTPQELRSKANGIINFMGGLGAAIAMFGGSFLYKLYPGAPFFAVAVMLVGVALAFFFWIREPAGATEQSERFSPRMVRDRSTILMLLAIFFWFISYNGVETWLTTYGTEHLHQETARVARLMTFVAASFLVMAIPAGFLAEGSRFFKGFGRKWSIMGGLGGMIVAYVLLSRLTDLSQGIPFLVLAGFAWAFVNINSFPMIAQMAPEGQMGTYTGLYYLFSSAANIVGPPMFGWVFDTLGYTYFFPVAILFMVLAAVCIFMVRKGEAAPASGVSAAD
ncbi:MAG TPA: MFS transporter [Symbiobacteriaceae bacterium]